MRLQTVFQESLFPKFLLFLPRPREWNPKRLPGNVQELLKVAAACFSLFSGLGGFWMLQGHLLFFRVFERQVSEEMDSNGCTSLKETVVCRRHRKDLFMIFGAASYYLQNKFPWMPPCAVSTFAMSSAVEISQKSEVCSLEPFETQT